MHNQESSRRNILNHVIVEVGFLLLWFGFIFYAFTTFFSIGADTKNTYDSLFVTPTKLNILLFESREGEGKTKLVNTKQQLKTSVSDKNFYTIFPAVGEDPGSLSIFNIGKDEVNGKIENNDAYEKINGSSLAFPFHR